MRSNALMIVLEAEVIRRLEICVLRCLNAHMHALIIICCYVLMITRLNVHMHVCSHDRLLTCINIQMFDIHTYLQKLG